MAVSSERLKKYGFDEELLEIEPLNYMNTGFPEPVKHKEPGHQTRRLIIESYQTPIEKWYYWVLDYMRTEYGYREIDKITDVFSASENSSFFGASQQRLGIQQDKVSGFLGIIGKMVKEIFQLVRELRIIDERLSFYFDSMSGSKSAESAEISLKGIWIDMVEQGSKNPASVYGLAKELGFATLPDLFFSIHPKKPEDVDAMVNALDFNRKVKEVLKRKLRTFMEWKKQTFHELQNKRKFTLKYLRQHFDIIKMYITWVKPYLRHIKKLSMNQKTLDSADLIGAFESSMIEVELLFKKKMGPLYSCVLVNFYMRTRPGMNYTSEYQRGPMHMGKFEFFARGYVWDEKTIEKYKKMKEEDDIELLSVVDGSVKAAMESLGDELMNYLKEAGEEFEDKKFDPANSGGKTKAPSAIDPFINVFKGFAELGSSFLGIQAGKKKNEPSEEKLWNSKNKATKYVQKSLWDCYKNFKKSFGMLAW